MRFLLILSIIISVIIFFILRTRMREKKAFAELHGESPDSDEARLVRFLWKDEFYQCRDIASKLSEEVPHISCVKTFLKLCSDLKDIEHDILTEIQYDLRYPADDVFRVRFEEKYGSVARWTPVELRGKMEKRSFLSVRLVLKIIEDKKNVKDAEESMDWIQEIRNSFRRSISIRCIEGYAFACLGKWENALKALPSVNQNDFSMEVYSNFMDAIKQASKILK